MRNYILILLLFGLSVNLSGQREDREERIRSLRIAYITDKLELTASESEKFWPIFNTYEKQKQTAHEEFRSIRKETFASDAEAELYIKKMQEYETSKLSMKNQYISDLRSVLDSKRIAILLTSEREFKHKILRTMKEKHKRGKKRSKETKMKKN